MIFVIDTAALKVTTFFFYQNPFAAQVASQAALQEPLQAEEHAPVHRPLQACSAH
ncbi:MAG TPA: hypothetical protein H9761_05830 [Candidatus Eisenbergiella merdavium]|uniref:Uncharacterized protein n=1 Tax=Candidatus Eisenbergiella merdavium TaxID=2838551 RepID=A0A9D2NDN5_9FIRM|nr:hypothetical protein [Candidatus Eisenbergiella merdavium]